MTESPHTSSITNHQAFAEALLSWIRTFEQSVCHVDLLAFIVLSCHHTNLFFFATQEKRRKTRKTTYRFQVSLSTSLFDATAAGVVCLMRNSSFRRFSFSFLVQVLLHCKSQGSSNVVSSFRSFLGTCSKEASCPMIFDTSPKCLSFWLIRR